MQGETGAGAALATPACPCSLTSASGGQRQHTTACRWPPFHSPRICLGSLPSKSGHHHASIAHVAVGIRGSHALPCHPWLGAVQHLVGGRTGTGVAWGLTLSLAEAAKQTQTLATLQQHCILLACTPADSYSVMCSGGGSGSLTTCKQQQDKGQWETDSKLASVRFHVQGMPLHSALGLQRSRRSNSAAGHRRRALACSLRPRASVVLLRMSSASLETAYCKRQRQRDVDMSNGCQTDFQCSMGRHWRHSAFCLTRLRVGLVIRPSQQHHTRRSKAGEVVNVACSSRAGVSWWSVGVI